MIVVPFRDYWFAESFYMSRFGTGLLMLKPVAIHVP